MGTKCSMTIKTKIELINEFIFSHTLRSCELHIYLFHRKNYDYKIPFSQLIATWKTSVSLTEFILIGTAATTTTSLILLKINNQLSYETNIREAWVKTEKEIYWTDKFMNQLKHGWYITLANLT